MATQLCLVVHGAMMRRVFQTFVDRLSESVDAVALQSTMAETAAALDLPCFAYLCLPRRPATEPRHITTYPAAWTSHYLRNRYERLDPVIRQVLTRDEPFEWSSRAQRSQLSKPEQQLFDEAAEFGINFGFTIPIHDGRGPIAAVTFATDEHRIGSFRRHIEEHGRVLQLMAMYFHAHARRTFVSSRIVDGVSLSPREFECLEWAARGKTAWETGRILSISRHTAAFYLDNAKAKLGVRTIVQAVARLAASKPIIQ